MKRSVLSALFLPFLISCAATTAGKKAAYSNKQSDLILKVAANARKLQPGTVTVVRDGKSTKAADLKTALETAKDNDLIELSAGRFDLPAKDTHTVMVAPHTFTVRGQGEATIIVAPAKPDGKLNYARLNIKQTNSEGSLGQVTFEKLKMIGVGVETLTYLAPSFICKESHFMGVSKMGSGSEDIGCLYLGKSIFNSSYSTIHYFYGQYYKNSRVTWWSDVKMAITAKQKAFKKTKAGRYQRLRHPSENSVRKLLKVGNWESPDPKAVAALLKAAADAYPDAPQALADKMKNNGKKAVVQNLKRQEKEKKSKFAESSAQEYPLTAIEMVGTNWDNRSKKIREQAKKFAAEKYHCQVTYEDGFMLTDSRKKSRRVEVRNVLRNAGKVNDPDGTKFINFIVNNDPIKFSKNCRFIGKIEKGVYKKDIKHKYLGEKYVKLSKPVIDLTKRNEFDYISRKIKNIEKARKLRADQAAQAAAWARVEAQAKGLQAQASQILNQAKARHQAVKDFNAAREWVRKNPGFKVVHKNVNAQAKANSTYLRDQREAERKAQALRQKHQKLVQQQWGLNAKDAKIYVLGADYYSKTEGNMEEVNYKGTVNFKGSAYKYVDGKRVEIEKAGPQTVTVEWNDYILPKDRDKAKKKGWAPTSPNPQDFKVVYMWNIVREEIKSYRTAKAKEYKTKFDAAKTNEDIVEMGLAYQIYSGKDPNKMAKFAKAKAALNL